MSDEYNPFLDDSASPQEEEFTHVDNTRQSNHHPENGAVSKENYNGNVSRRISSSIWYHL